MGKTNTAIRVLSERLMTRGFEGRVETLMENVQKVVRAQPGLLSVETLRDINDHHKYIVLSEWKSKESYDNWLQSKEFKECTAQIDEVLDIPGKKTQIFKRPADDVFLL